MNPWYKQCVEDCMAEHDQVCLDGAGCPERETHTMKAYVTVALRERVEALQGQVGRVRALLDRMEGGGYSAVTTTFLRRALDGEQ